MIAVPIVGALGTEAGTTTLLAEETVLVPSAFVAVTVNVYDELLVSPVMTSGDDTPYVVRPPELA